MPEPYGSPSAPACVICVCTFAAVTAAGNAGTVTCSVPTYFDVLVTSFWKPPVELHAVPVSSGSTSVGVRVPQITWYHVLERLLPHCVADAHSTGMDGDGWLLCQSVVTSPRFVSCRTTSPTPTGASSALPWSCVVQSSVKLVAVLFLSTVTFS